MEADTSARADPRERGKENVSGTKDCAEYKVLQLCHRKGARQISDFASSMHHRKVSPASSMCLWSIWIAAIQVT